MIEPTKQMAASLGSSFYAKCGQEWSSLVRATCVCMCAVGHERAPCLREATGYEVHLWLGCYKTPTT